MVENLFVTKMRKTRCLNFENLNVNLYLDVLKRPDNTKNKYGLFFSDDDLSFLNIEKMNHKTVSISVNPEKRDLYLGKTINIYIPYHIEDINFIDSDVDFFNIYNSNINRISSNSSKINFNEDVLIDRLSINATNDSQLNFKNNLAINDLDLDLENSRLNFSKESLIFNLKFNVYSSTIKTSEYTLIHNIADFNLLGSSFVNLSCFCNFIICNMSLQSKFFTYSTNYYLDNQVKNKGQGILDNIVKENNNYIKYINDNNIYIDIKYTIEEFIKNQEFSSIKERIFDENDVAFQLENSFNNESDNEFDDFEEIDDFEELENIDDVSDEEFLDSLTNKSEFVYENNFKNLLTILKEVHPTEHINDNNREFISKELRTFIEEHLYKGKDKRTLIKIEKICFVLDINFKLKKACQF